MASLATFFPKKYYGSFFDPRSKLPHTHDHLLISRDHLTRFTDCSTLGVQLVSGRPPADANKGRPASAGKVAAVAGLKHSKHGEHGALRCKLRIFEGWYRKGGLQTGDEYAQAVEVAVRRGESLGREDLYAERRRGNSRSQGGRARAQQPREQPDWFAPHSAELQPLVAELRAAEGACNWDRNEANVARLLAARSSLQRAVRRAKREYELGSSPGDLMRPSHAPWTDRVGDLGKDDAPSG